MLWLSSELAHKGANQRLYVSALSMERRCSRAAPQMLSAEACMFISQKPDFRAFYSLNHLPRLKRCPRLPLLPSNQPHTHKIDVSY
jgi:hypothetical protein